MPNQEKIPVFRRGERVDTKGDSKAPKPVVTRDQVKLQREIKEAQKPRSGGGDEAA